MIEAILTDAVRAELQGAADSDGPQWLKDVIIATLAFAAEVSGLRLSSDEIHTMVFGPQSLAAKQFGRINPHWYLNRSD